MSAGGSAVFSESDPNDTRGHSCMHVFTHASCVLRTLKGQSGVKETKEQRRDAEHLNGTSSLIL